MDNIKIKKLDVFAKHGVYKEENVLGQKFVFSAVLYLDTAKAGVSDELEDSVNYGEVCHFIREFAEGRTFKLLESLAEHTAAAVLDRKAVGAYRAASGVCVGGDLTRMASSLHSVRFQYGR